MLPNSREQVFDFELLLTTLTAEQFNSKYSAT